jgi:replicative superfamily II helicase
MIHWMVVNYRCLLSLENLTRQMMPQPWQDAQQRAGRPGWDTAGHFIYTTSQTPQLHKRNKHHIQNDPKWQTQA